MKVTVRRAIAAISLAMAIGSVGLTGAASARVSAGSDTGDTGVTLDELKRLAGADANPSTFMQDSEGEPRGSGVPPVGGKRTRIGKRIVADEDVRPPGRQSNKLNWHGFPNDVMAAVGQLFGVGPEGDYTCTGTVVTRGLVITAGHCVEDAQQILFTPGSTWNDPQSSNPYDIKAPYGVWRAVRWWAPESFLNQTSRHDWGVVQIAPGTDGTYVGDVVGSWPMMPGIKFDDGARIYSVGYAASGYWATTDGKFGRGQYACDDRWAAGAWLPSDGGYELWITCPMNGGASGGPWFVQLNNGSWVIGGVNNWCNDDVTEDDTDGVCTPVSQDVRSLVFDNMFLEFWNSLLPLVT